MWCRYRGLMVADSLLLSLFRDICVISCIGLVYGSLLNKLAEVMQ
jgi:hypothetical protein